MNGDRLAGLRASAGELRPELHRYCARLMGSVIDGEDVVQDALARAFVALQEFEEKGFAQMPPLRPWLFRIAHNRALDLLRGRAVRMAEPIEAALDVADPANPDALEMLMRQEAVKTAVSRFAELSTVQRSVVILKDVLDESLSEIAAFLDLTVDAVKGHLARGRARLREINAQADPRQEARPASATVARYVALFNRQDWDGLRALLADDVRLIQSTYSASRRFRGGRSILHHLRQVRRVDIHSVRVEPRYDRFDVDLDAVLLQFAGCFFGEPIAESGQDLRGRLRIGALAHRRELNCRKLCLSARLDNSAIWPAISTPVGPPPTTTNVSHARRTSGSSSNSAISNAPNIRSR